MPRTWRAWIATLLVVALPLQAVAAAGACCLSHAGTASPSQGQPEGHEAGQGGIGTGADGMAASAPAAGAPCHTAGSEYSAGHPATTSGVPHDEGFGRVGADACHGCSACAMGPALPVAAGPTPGPASASAPEAPAPVPAAVRAPPPPEPPPRA